MRFATPFSFIGASLLLHAALVTAAVSGWFDHQEKSLKSQLLAVRLLPAPAEIAPSPSLPVPSAPPTEKKRPSSKPEMPPQISAKAPAKPQDSLTRQTQSADTATDQKPAAAAAPAAPFASAISAAAASIPVRIPPSDASYATSNRTPPYPLLSQRYEEQGTVVLRVLVKANGGAGDVQIKTSSGYPLLDESARNTVRTWRFKPGTSDGKAIDEWYQVAIPFTLRN